MRTDIAHLDMAAFLANDGEPAKKEGEEVKKVKIFTVVADCSGGTENHEVIGDGMQEERALDIIQTRLTPFEIREMDDAQRRGEEAWVSIWLVKAVPIEISEENEDEYDDLFPWEHNGVEYEDIYKNTLDVIHVTRAIYFGDAPLPKFKLSERQKEELQKEGIDVPEAKE